MKLLKDLKRERCLDVGCGDGKFTSALPSEVKDVLGIDYSERAVHFAKNLVPEATFLVADAAHLCFKDETFDVVTCLDVMEHLPKYKRERTIKEMYRVIKRRGIFIFSVPSKNMPLIKKHYTHFDKADFSKILARVLQLDDEITFVGCGVYYPIFDRVQNFPIVWRLINKLIIKTCAPDRARTLIVKVRRAE
jgi:ubiquinone/menaquinone biosynthesis C-methylase UbiE